MDRRFPIVEFDANRFSDFFGDLSNSLEVQWLTGGACNSNYLVSTPDGASFVCRIHKRGNPLIEKSVVELLGKGIPAPGYLWTGDEVSVLRFIEGEHFRPTRNLVREAGRMIGKLNAISFDCAGQFTSSGDVVPFDGWDSFYDGVSDLLVQESVQRWLEPDCLVELKQFLDRHGKVLETFDACHNLVHGDFGPSNILVSGDSITGIIDWEFAHSGCSYMDVGNFLRHVPSVWEGDFAWGLQAEGFDLPDDWRFRSLLIDLASHLEFLTSDRSEEFKARCVERVVKLIRAGD